MGARRSRLAGAFLFACTAFPAPASAHAFGARYDLPLPLWLYLTGAGAAVALTFLLLALFARRTDREAATYETSVPWLSRLVLRPSLRAIAGAVSVFFLLLIILTGSLGEQNPVKNFAPVSVWVIWWVGFAFFVALAANVWPAVNPWLAIHDGVVRIVKAAGRSGRERAVLRYPAALGMWPSVILFVCFAWIELVSEAGESPRTLVCLIIAYSALTWVGLALFGRDKWLASGEAFHQAFGVFGRFAPLGVASGRIVLRPYGAGLLTREPVHRSMTAFVILMLSTVTFDGFVETPLWADFLEWLSEDRTLRPALIWLQRSGIDLLAAAKTVALLLFPVAFLAIYLAFCTASYALAGGGVALSTLANTLVLSLVPIAIAYHVAHYLSYLLLAGQLMVPLASDPFGWGWNLFGTAGHAIDVGIIDAATVWYVAIVAIVSGHVIAVWLAHVMALAQYGDSRRALLSQLPMLVLMVLYTMTSLWILSQPIVEV